VGEEVEGGGFEFEGMKVDVDVADDVIKSWRVGCSEASLSLSLSTLLGVCVCCDDEDEVGLDEPAMVEKEEEEEEREVGIHLLLWNATCRNKIIRSKKKKWQPGRRFLISNNGVRIPTESRRLQSVSLT
jgi:hypothetical protein